jgi:hypothetical protein
VTFPTKKLSLTNVTRQADTKWLLSQMVPGETWKYVSTSSELVYPMPTWEQKVATAAVVPPPATTPVSCNETATIHAICIDEDDLGQKTLDIASATLAFTVVTVVGCMAYSYYASVIPSQQVITKVILFRFTYVSSMF